MLQHRGFGVRQARSLSWKQWLVLLRDSPPNLPPGFHQASSGNGLRALFTERLGDNKDQNGPTETSSKKEIKERITCCGEHWRY